MSVIFQFKQLERRRLKKSGFQWDSNLWPPWCQCDTLPTELWGHTLGARSNYWVHVSCEERNDVKYKWNKFIFQLRFKYELFTSHHFTPHGKYELNKLTLLPMCGFTPCNSDTCISEPKYTCTRNLRRTNMCICVYIYPHTCKHIQYMRICLISMYELQVTYCFLFS